MLRALALLALLLPGCGSPRWAVVASADTWGRHHGRCLVGPRATWANGTEVTIQGGRQFAVWAPGEPHYSERAPDPEWVGSVEVVVPIGGG